MKRSIFRQGCVALLLFSSLALWATVSIRDAAAMSQGNSAPVGNPADIEAVKQLGRTMGDAMVAVDIDKLNKIYADDWATVGSSGEVRTKQSVLDNLKSGKYKLIWYELGPIDVQVVGDVAVAHGSVKEKSIYGGKEFNGDVLYMDLLKKSAGKWTVVRSASTKTNAAAMSQGNSAPVGNPADIEAVKQLGRSMGDAMVADDIDKLNKIYADDWATVGSSGEVRTKQSVLENFKSGKDKLVSFDLGPIDVQVVGDVAVAHGSVKEKRIQNGKEFNGEVLYMDLLKKRAGKWVVIRSAGARA